MRTDALRILFLLSTIVGGLLVGPNRAGAGLSPRGPCPPAIGGPPIPAPVAQAPAYVPPRLPSTRDRGPNMVARGKSDDRTPALRIPTPDELGIGTAKLAGGDEPVDWNLVERRLDAAGVTAFQVEKTGVGFRFTCLLASGAVSGRGATKGEAVRNALAQLTR